ncbi:MAG: hypothetical protein KDE58_08780 [Caldilineaceae bacterium]|nr:hypothetical protein [Caldilineaceae bacterium]
MVKFEYVPAMLWLTISKEEIGDVVVWRFGPRIVRLAIMAAADGDDHAESHGVSLAMINQQLPEVLNIEGWH